MLTMLGACAAPKDEFSLRPSAGQQAMVRDGVPSLYSSKTHTVFLRPLAPQQQTGQRPRFVIALINKGKTPATFNVSSITVQSTYPRKANLRVYTHAELAEEVETARNTQLALTAISGALGSYSASQSGYSYTTGSTRYGSYSQTTYNPAVAQAAINANADRTADNFASIENNAQAKLAELQSTVIKDHTLMPGEWHGGVIVIDPPDKAEGAGAEYSISLTSPSAPMRCQRAPARPAPPPSQLAPARTS
jgi:hypothetical protein